jgi:hypothetical protein
METRVITALSGSTRLRRTCHHLESRLRVISNDGTVLSNGNLLHKYWISQTRGVTMLKKMIGLSLVVVLCGCAIQPIDTLGRKQFEQLPNKYSQFDLKLAWDNKIYDNGIIVEGVIWNVRWLHAEGVEVWVSLLSPDGRVLDKDVSLILPHSLDINEKADFSVKLKSKPVPGSRLLFTYRYHGVDDTEGSASWMQSFESKL